MSMREYPINFYGLVLSDRVLKAIASSVCEDFNEEDWHDDAPAFIEELRDRLDLVYVSGFDGEAIRLRDDGTDDFANTHSCYSDDEVNYVPLYMGPKLIGTAYRDMDEIVEEIRDRIGEYLPEDYNIREDICHIVGTTFC